jgi:hypothetical protein
LTAAIFSAIGYGDAHLIVERHFPASTVARNKQAISSAALVKFNPESLGLEIVDAIDYRVIVEMLSKGVLLRRGSDGYGLCTYYELAEMPTYDRLVSNRCTFEVNHVPSAAKITTVNNMAAEFGFKIVFIKPIRAFRLESIADSELKLNDPYIHGIVRIREFNVAQWKRAIVDTLRREGVEIKPIK